MKQEITTFLLCIIMPMLFFPNFVWAAGNLTQNSSRECAICHFRWMDQFVAGHGTELAPLETEDVAGHEMMCLSCHDGSTDDSRTKIWLRDRHQTGMTPSAKVKIPKIFPLSHEGKMVCATCHSAHSVPTDTSIERTIFLRISSFDSQMCEMCHVEKHSNKNINHPLHTGKSPIPVQIIEAGGVLSVKDSKKLICESCHTAHGGVEHKNLLFPAKDSTLCGVCHTQQQETMTRPAKQLVNHPLQVEVKTELQDELQRQQIFPEISRRVQCLSCHQIHGNAPLVPNAAPEKLLRFSAGNSSLCIICHPDKNSDKTSQGIPGNHPLHQKIAEPTLIEHAEVLKAGRQVQCLSCHQVHQSPGSPRALVVQRDALCAACHREKEFIKGTDHDLSITAPLTENQNGQPIITSGLCGSCHVPHKAKGPFLWAGPHDNQEGAPSSLCLACHNTKGAAAKKTVGSFSHPVQLTTKTNSSLPFYGSIPKRILACPTCHDPHRWSPSVAGKGPGINSEGNAKNSFLRLEAGANPALCQSCHVDKFTVAGTDHDLLITSPNTANINGKTVAAGGVCSSCHTVHNATSNALWSRSFRDSDRSMSALCITCHSENQPADQKRVGEYSHPLHISIPATAHLPSTTDETNRPTIECHTCHDPHRWQPGTIARGPGKNTEGLADTSFLRKPNLEKPLLCQSCHREQAQVTGTDHDLRQFSRSREKKPATPGKISVCNPCHKVHNSPQKLLLWNGPVAARGQDYMERICNGCHDTNQAGSTKIITSGSHPTRLYFGYRASYRNLAGQSGEKTEPVPLYDTSGRRTDTGEITCPTCHDPHVWSAGPGEDDKSGEGSITNSFLRAGARNEICYACHGMNTLLLYRFYHDSKVKQQIRGKNLPQTGTVKQQAETGN